MKAFIQVSSTIEPTPRVEQVRGMFDLKPDSTSTLSWNVHLPIDEQPWNIGVIVGPSGCGKSTIVRHLWPQAHRRLQQLESYNPKHTVLDAFPENLSIKDIVELLSSVGFSSPPAWLRPFHVLSTGQQFRVSLARLIADQLTLPLDPPPPPMVYDE